MVTSVSSGMAVIEHSLEFRMAIGVFSIGDRVDECDLQNLI
jgi:hypothetical protein